jgi:hypothetical protein
MADYLDAEDDDGSASHSLILWMLCLLSTPGRRDRFVLPTPRHILERLKEIDKFALMERPEHPGFTGPNKAAAIRDKAVHRVCNAFMVMSAGINAVVPGETSQIPGASHGRKV